jgi:hypothetical protein
MGPRFLTLAKVRAIGLWSEIPQGTIWEEMVIEEEEERVVDKETVQSSSYMSHPCPFIVPSIFSFGGLDVENI